MTPRSLRDAAWRYAEDWGTPTERDSLARLVAALDGHLDGDADTVATEAEVERDHVAGAADEATVGPLGGLASVAAGGAEDREDGHGGEGSALSGVGPDGEWPPGLLGVALRVGESVEEADPDDDSCRQVVLVDWADVATRTLGTVRVRLRRPVERLERVWASDVVAREEDDE